MSLSVPLIASVMVTSNMSTLTCPIGSNIALTCTVKLSQADGIEVNLSISWNGPNAADIYIMTEPYYRDPNSSYSGTAIVRSFGEEHYGYYTCLANVTAIGSVTKYFHYSNFMAYNGTQIKSGI